MISNIITNNGRKNIYFSHLHYWLHIWSIISSHFSTSTSYLHTFHSSHLHRVGIHHCHANPVAYLQHTPWASYRAPYKWNTLRSSFYRWNTAHPSYQRLTTPKERSSWRKLQNPLQSVQQWLTLVSTVWKICNAHTWKYENPFKSVEESLTVESSVRRARHHYEIEVLDYIWGSLWETLKLYK